MVEILMEDNSGIYYCHYCKSERTENQLDFLLSEEIKCLECQMTGFVEKDYVIESDVNTGQNTIGQNTIGQNTIGQNTVYSLFPENQSNESIFSIFGMPLNTFISDLFQGSFCIPMRSVDRNVPMEVRFANDMASFVSSFPFQLTRVENTFEINPEDFSRVFSTFISDPFNNQSLNQVLQFIMQSDPNRYGSPPASREFINNLKVHTLNEELAKEYESCSICTEEFQQGDQVHWLTDNKDLCKHVYHVNCIIPWLKRRNSCPVCRFEVPTDDENYNNQKELLRNQITQEVQRNLNTNTTNN
ncbi:uncharacterized protein TA09745 [Theileria annulata]|uniref:RING-type domain-containing protein n=1 Tax=Theileria annulata TaxID=5874 RepID=Q4UJ59_THEAN|nr:uncharacterized protein TA09745 [Theileria annulata]CAI72880.1 hypothetical protein, conserved [Theileria annulata]|eukprot:XP_953558.1 hypothetical protein, conserved [Theileria annulata]